MTKGDGGIDVMMGGLVLLEGDVNLVDRQLRSGPQPAQYETFDDLFHQALKPRPIAPP